MFNELPETHSDFRFLSRRTRDIITVFMILFSAVGLFALSMIMLRILWLLL